MQYGLKERVIKDIQCVFSKCRSIETVILYGSRAKGNYKNGSDIDLTVIAPDLLMKDLLHIENELDELLLPYKFDVSLYHHIDNRDLIDHIERVGIVFYKKI